ncbi:MAG: pyridoxamine 5'-phosphate oxidase [Saprospiraceae bacterium]|nr:pyridoxamine 5'-phosphate oxidase [Saprospiraceae bacterium]
MDYKDLRKEYLKHSLELSDLDPDPILQFKRWFHEAIRAKVDEPNAMVCATVSKEGKPSCRYVLLKGLRENRFVFFTNYNSRKGIELTENKFCSLVFFWRELERQVRVEGMAEKSTEEYSDEYFESRPLGSRISSLVSPQSAIIPSKAVLEEELKKWSELDAGLIKRPVHWGGFEIIPDRMEFWQGRQDRLHDRVCYQKKLDSSWELFLLAP